jgi:hypothetical protein
MAGAAHLPFLPQRFTIGLTQHTGGIAMPDTRHLTVRLTEETLPPYDAGHGTPNAVVRRELTFELPEGAAKWEQTDYGHPGRFNPWDPRGIDAKLQAKTERLRAAADALSALLD